MSDLHDELIQEVRLAHEEVDRVIERVNAIADSIEELATDVDNAHEAGKEALNG